jgi:FMN phosphatase YigB (HAD superfamily)
LFFVPWLPTTEDQELRAKDKGQGTVYQGIRLEFNGIKILAVDLIGTLAKRVGMTFAGRGSEHLAKNGYEIAPARLRSLHRKRYLEYTLGNYANDGEFYSVLSADLSGEAGQPLLETLTDIWLQCSPAFDDAQPFLEQASRTHRLILSSNYVGEWARRLLAENHWEEYFQGLVVSSECRFRKPSRQFFLELLKVSGAKSPDEILVIGDSLVNDMYGAATAGLHAVLVDRNTEASERESPESVPCVQSLDELMQCMTNKQLISR